MPQQLLERKDVKLEDTWDLSPIFENDEAWEEEFKSVSKALEEVKAYENNLTQSADKLLAGLKFRDDVSYRLNHLYVYSHLNFDTDTTNATYQNMDGKVRGLIARFSASFSFFDTEILSASEDKIKGYLDENKALGLYKHQFDILFKSRKHILSEKEEKLLATMGQVFSNPSQTFGMINNADIDLPTIKDTKGEAVKLTHGRYSLFMEDKNREVRKNAFEGMHNAYKDLNNTLASTLSGQIKIDNLNAQVRGFDSARHGALFSNHIDEDVFDALLKGIHDNIHLMHDYVALRKEALELDSIEMYDIYVPMVKEVDLKFTYEEAQEVILEALSILGDEYHAVLKKAFNERWVDVYENKGKRSGAYSSGVYGTRPYILMNWQDNIDNLFTLAHELGHSVHSYFTRKYQPFIYGDYSIFLAEVASTTNENLLLNYLLDEYKDDEDVTAYLLNHYLDTVKGTVFRQTQFAEFEHLIHTSDQNNQTLTADFLNTSYHKLNEFYYGKEINSDHIQYEWSRIPHFYYNYYVYQYATGFSAATLFSEMIYNGGDVTPYLDFLKAGSHKYPIDVLKDAGVDMTEPTAVDTTLQNFGKRMEALKTLILK
ncbi:MAG TPA: oligoendopeptidase F [Erysipelothrix sp.]|nr:oligoendopeptidase F [Erysipelothrix sp.]